LPVHYGDGQLPNYIEASSGQFYIDPVNEKRGNRHDADPKSHNVLFSRFHKTSQMCATCHDVSNPVLANLVHGAGTSERQSAASYFHVERTFSEFMLSAYGRPGGAATGAPAATAGIGWASSCQDCHMKRAVGRACNKNVPVRQDLATHDLTGANAWMTMILASLDQKAITYDAYNYAILSGAKYPGARIDVSGLQGVGLALASGAVRARATVRRAATVERVAEDSSSLTVRIVNHTGHKLPSGFPEGRRAWLQVTFYDVDGAVISEINPYEPLVAPMVNGQRVYQSGGILTTTHDEAIFEASMSSALTGEEKTFHFVLATDRYKDNRIPPRGFDVAGSVARLAHPRHQGADALDLYSENEYEGGYRALTLPKPPEAAGWTATLRYQTTSKEYVEFLRDQIAGTGGTLPSPTLVGDATAYVAQSDPFFSSLRDWGRALWDLWLHNGGSAPMDMARGISSPQIRGLEMDPAAGFRIRFAALPGRTYRLQACDDLAAGVWSDVGPLLEGRGGEAELVDPVASGMERRFYRLINTLPEL
jgi:hypothetical protein